MVAGLGWFAIFLGICIIWGCLINSADALQPPAKCKTLSVIVKEVPGGIILNPDGTSETVSKLKYTVTQKCRGKIVVKVYYKAY